MTLTSRALNRATLARQMLLRRERTDAVSAARRVFAIQAQEPASPYVALWNRVAGFDPAELDAAFASGAVLKATLMRMTLHAVASGDYARLHRAVAPAAHAARVRDARFGTSRMSAAEIDDLCARVVEYASEPRTNSELKQFCGNDDAWLALRLFVPLLHAPTGATWTFGARPSYLAAPPADDDTGRDIAVAHYVRRYLEAFGPATLLDVAQFTKLSRGELRAALATLDTEDLGDGYVDLPGLPRPAATTAAPPRLMAMWDSALLAYADRSRVIPPDYRAHVIRTNGDTLPTLLVDGYVAGVWRAEPHGIEAAAFHELPDEAWAGLRHEARLLSPLLAREPEVYRRYRRWWDVLPAVEVRLLS